MGDLPYGPSVGDLVNWAKICSDGASIAEGGDETLVPMTSAYRHRPGGSVQAGRYRI